MALGAERLWTSPLNGLWLLPTRWRTVLRGTTGYSLVLWRRRKEGFTWRSFTRRLSLRDLETKPHLYCQCSTLATVSSNPSHCDGRFHTIASVTGSVHSPSLTWSRQRQMLVMVSLKQEASLQWCHRRIVFGVSKVSFEILTFFSPKCFFYGLVSVFIYCNKSSFCTEVFNDLSPSYSWDKHVC